MSHAGHVVLEDLMTRRSPFDYYVKLIFKFCKFCLSMSTSLGFDSGGRHHTIDKAMARGTHSKRCRLRAMTRDWSCLSFASFTEQSWLLCWKDVMSQSISVLHNTVAQWAPFASVLMQTVLWIQARVTLMYLHAHSLFVRVLKMSGCTCKRQ